MLLHAQCTTYTYTPCEHTSILPRAVFELTKLAVPHLMSSHGNIVNVSSLNAIRSVGYIATDR